MASTKLIRGRAWRLLVVGWLLGLSLPAAIRAADPFEEQVAPILLRRCLECHNDKDAAGGLRLSSAEGLSRGGDSGAAVSPGKGAESLLVQRVAAGEMPPSKQGKSRQLPAAEIAALRAWVDAGAKFPAGRKLDQYERTTDVRGGRDWWSFQPLARPSVPTVPKWPERVRNPIDSFVFARLAEANLEPAPELDARRLVRRLFYDLTGLAPTAEQTEAFVADPSDAAYERLVDDLLASPRFGERWGRYWLDLVRYADTCGYERDQEKPHAWRYRDWVIRALNEDLPYDQFVIKQLAGDELPQRTEEDVVATGFLRLGTWNDEPNDPQEYKYERLEDLVHTTSTAFLGLTVKCARCHDHKFDPVPQLDYYRVAAAFWAGPIEPRGRELLGGPTRDELGFDVLGWTDLSASPPPLKWLRKGDPRFPQDEVPAGYLTALPNLDRSLAPPAAGSKTTQRRLQLAQWIVDPRNPLTPRIIVNRLWLHHFGRALVRSPDNFGYTGQKPTHPELLDWLSQQLIDGQWRLKRMHKLLVMSSVYRQASLHPREAEQAGVDAENRSWWHAERRRLDAESLRDSFLAAAGQLDLRPGGPGFKPTIAADALEGLSRKSGAWSPSSAVEQRRRSVYMYSQRSLLPPLMTTFDFCDTTQPCGQRDVSIVAPQALALLNNPFLHEQSAALAARVEAESGADASLERLVDTAWRRSLGRAPSERERQAATGHLKQQVARFRPEAGRPQPQPPRELPHRNGLALHLLADGKIELDDNQRVTRWFDQSGKERHADQRDGSRRPAWVARAVGERPVVRFDGQPRELQVAGQVVNSQQFTIFAVATDRGSGSHRGLFSNWNGAAGNSVQSLFLGTTGEAAVRLSDDFAPAGTLTNKERPFVWTAVSETADAIVFQNRAELARRGRALAARNLATAYVIGQQGNINGEFWNGDVAELIVFDRALDGAERADVWRYLEGKYGLEPAAPAPVSPERRALESLCLVLLNSNEFAYVD